MKPKILITGGAGYIGSHTCLELLQAGLELVVVDNLCNSKQVALNRVEAICGQRIAFHHADIRDREKLQSIFREHAIHAVIHFAGLKAVGESVEKPLEYYDANVNGTLVLLDVMAAAGVKSGVQLIRHGLWRAACRSDQGRFSAGAAEPLCKQQAHD